MNEDQIQKMRADLEEFRALQNHAAIEAQLALMEALGVPLHDVAEEEDGAQSHASGAGD